MKKSNLVISTPMVLFALLTILKLSNVINWSWWWIISPIWIPIVLVIAFLILTCIVLSTYEDQDCI